jgi:hypothetical protein
MPSPVDRSHYPVRKISLADEGRELPSSLTPAQRVAMVWPLTVEAWTFKDGRFDESRLRRDVVRVVRRGRGDGSDLEG